MDYKFSLSSIAPRVNWCLVLSAIFFKHAGDVGIVILEVQHLQSSITDIPRLHNVAHLVVTGSS